VRYPARETPRLARGSFSPWHNCAKTPSLSPRPFPILFSIQADEELPEIEAQKRHVADFLGQARQSLSLLRIQFSPAPKLSALTFDGLPPGIHLTPGRLAIEFRSATELLRDAVFPVASARERI